jgi:hypothetical protein
MPAFRYGSPSQIDSIIQYLKKLKGPNEKPRFSAR